MLEARLQQVIAAGRALTRLGDVDAVLQRLLDAARDVTGAGYAASSPATHEPLHPSGAQAGNPAMTTLDVPVRIDGEAWATLHLAEKVGGFTEADEEAALALADFAGVAIAQVRLREQLEQTSAGAGRDARTLRVAFEVSRALAGMTDVDRVLDLVVKRSRVLVGARSAEVVVFEGDDAVVAAAAGAGVEGVSGLRMPLHRSVGSTVLPDGVSRRFDAPPPGTFAADELGVQRALVAPMRVRERLVGALVAFDRLEGDAPFDAEEERTFVAFAAFAAAAMSTARTAADEALRRSIDASEDERRRWARELHDQTLQDLASLRLLLSTARAADDGQELESAVDAAVATLTDGVADLRALINDLRPPALDRFGLGAALGDLVERVGARSALRIDLRSRLRAEDDGGRHPEVIETTVYRLAQEALTNVVKHAHATRATVEVIDRPQAIELAVTDDGDGMTGRRPDSGGTGLIGMRERLALVRGTLDIATADGGGTVIRARIPLRPDA